MARCRCVPCSTGPMDRSIGPEGLGWSAAGVRAAGEVRHHWGQTVRQCTAPPRTPTGAPSQVTTNPTSRPALGRVCSTNCVTTSSCTREQPRGSVHLIRHLASRLRRLAPSVTKLHVGHSAKGGGVANASPSRLLALGVVGSIERNEGRFNTNSALRGLVAAGVGGGG